MAQNICSFQDVNVQNIKFSAPKGNADNMGKTVYFYHNSKPLYLQTCNAKAPFGLKEWDNNKYTFNLSLSNSDLLEKIKELEEFFVDSACKNYAQWFGSKNTKSREVVAELFSSSISWSKNTNAEYPPTLKINVPFRDGKFNCEGYKKCNNEIIPVEVSKDELFGGVQVQVILQISGIWIIGSKFGCTYKLAQFMIGDDLPKKIRGYAFIDDEDDHKM